MQDPAKSDEIRQQLVVVLGMHRSGTSAITRGLQVLGVELGDRLMPPIANNNDKGFWEDIDVVAFNEELLTACGRSWHSLDPIQQVDVDFLCDCGYLTKAVELLQNKLAGHKRFGFKDPRTTKLLQFWVRVFYIGGFDVRYIFVLRNPVSVVKSLARRDHFDAEISYLIWAEYVVSFLSHVDSEKTIAVDYDRFMQDPGGELYRIADWLDAKLDSKELSLYCSQFLEEGLRHSKFVNDDINSDGASPVLVREISGFLEKILAGRISFKEAVTFEKVNIWRDELDRLRPILRWSDKLHLRVVKDECLQIQLEAEKQNAREQILYRDALIAELKTQLEAEKQNAREQILYRDALVAELQILLEAEKDNVRKLSLRNETLLAELQKASRGPLFWLARRLMERKSLK